MSITVKTQTQLDKALKGGSAEIIIDSPAGVWLTLESTGSSSVVARGSSRVVAWGSSSVVARDSSSVEARDSSSVEAWGSSRVVASDSSRVVARDSSSVEASGSSRVVAWGSSSVEAWDSSSVVARDSSSVEARGSSSVEARDSSSVVASKYVAIHLHSQRVTLTGDGHVIDVTGMDTYKVDDFIAYHGVKVQDGHAVVYKAVDENWIAGHGYSPTAYRVGETVTAADWQPTNECGHGLHFGHRPAVANGYAGGNAAHIVECLVPVEGLIALGDKVKSESCFVVREVDLFGEAI